LKTWAIEVTFKMFALWEEPTLSVGALDAGLVDELTIIAPVIRGGGKGLLEGFSNALDLEHLGVGQSQYATFINYGVKRP
jgi:hypothetical protein